MLFADASNEWLSLTSVYLCSCQLVLEFSETSDGSHYVSTYNYSFGGELLLLGLPVGLVGFLVATRLPEEVF